MAENHRTQRLIADLNALRALKEASTIFDFQCSGDPPDRYTVILHGRGIHRDTSPRAEVEVVELHRCELRLPYSYPKRPPDLRWLTPIFHPNVSFSGFITLRDLGLPWDDALGLDVVCERLWDVARLAYMNLDKATNYSAKNWFERDCELQLPVDPRPLRDTQAPSASNVVRYQRRSAAPAPPGEQRATDVFFIGEDTPTPAMPPRPRTRRARSDGDDIFYIGDE